MFLLLKRRFHILSNARYFLNSPPQSDFGKHDLHRVSGCSLPWCMIFSLFLNFWTNAYYDEVLLQNYSRTCTLCSVLLHKRTFPCTLVLVLLHNRRNNASSALKLEQDPAGIMILNIEKISRNKAIWLAECFLHGGDWILRLIFEIRTESYSLFYNVRPRRFVRS